MIRRLAILNSYWLRKAIQIIESEEFYLRTMATGGITGFADPHANATILNFDEDKLLSANRHHFAIGEADKALKIKLVQLLKYRYGGQALKDKLGIENPDIKPTGVRDGGFTFQIFAANKRRIADLSVADWSCYSPMLRDVFDDLEQTYYQKVRNISLSGLGL